MVVSFGVAFVVAFVALAFSIASRLSPLGLLQGRPPVLRPVGLAHGLVGLLHPLFGFWLSAACSFFVNFFVSPVYISYFVLARIRVFDV